MTEEVLTPEVMPKEALLLITQSGVEQSTAQQLEIAFNSMFADARKWVEQAQTIKVTSVDQVREMKMARENRLALREIRCNAENTRKRLKADTLAKGKAIDGIANVLKALIEPVETYLEDQEKFKERKEEQERNELRTARLQALSAWMDVSAISYDVALMPQEQFDMMLNGARSKREAEIAEATRIERERIEAEELARKEREELEAKRVKELEEAKAKAIEEERLRKEQEEKSRLEREALEAKMRKEREESDRLAREAKAKADAEIKEMQDKADAERKERERLQAEADAKAGKEREEKEAQERADIERVEAEKLASEQSKTTKPTFSFDGFAVYHKPDGCWFSFTASNGRSAYINLNIIAERSGAITGSAIAQWIIDTQPKQGE